MKKTKSNTGYGSELLALAEASKNPILRVTRMGAPNCEFDLIIINTMQLAERLIENPDFLINSGIELWDIKTAPNYSKLRPEQIALGVKKAVVTPNPIEIKWG